MFETKLELQDLFPETIATLSFLMLALLIFILKIKLRQSYLKLEQFLLDEKEHAGFLKDGYRWIKL